MPARMDPGTTNQYLSREYADAVLASGGMPMILPLLEKPSVLKELAGKLDGILLTGSSSDVDPRRYGTDPIPQCGPVQPLRDETDFCLLDLAFESKTPVLAICFGLQSLNVFLGGSLVQDIGSVILTPIQHDEPASQGRPSHEIRIAEGSVLESLAGGTKARVNSTHHQAIDRLGEGLEVIARAPDDIIEAVQYKAGDGFVLGVQWHPEKSFPYDDLSKEIFKLFMNSCRESASAE